MTPQQSIEAVINSLSDEAKVALLRGHATACEVLATEMKSEDDRVACAALGALYNALAAYSESLLAAAAKVKR